MIIGAHVSAAGGVWNAPANAADLGLETFQIFTRPPQGGPAPVLSTLNVDRFKAEMKKYGFADFVIHAPYFTNLGSANNRIYYGTISVLKLELERGSLLGASYVMFHPGSLGELGQKAGMKKVIEGVGKALEGYTGKTKLLVEISAGAGSIYGDTFEELAQILQGNQKYLRKTLGGICFDTQHAFAAGYDLLTEESILDVFQKFDKMIGLQYLKLIHANDSKVALGGYLDRHEHIGEGKIGLEGFQALNKFLKSKKIDVSWILETKEAKREQDVERLFKIKRTFVKRTKRT